MTQRTIRERYYYQLSIERKKEFRQEMCRRLKISEYDLYRRMRLHCFKPLEWDLVLDYIDNHAL